jgi:hypothetical protein
MSMMGKLTFFLGIQVKQTKQGTFVHHAKYTKDLMKKFNMAELKLMSTSMSTAMMLDPDKNGEDVDQREYWSMISSFPMLFTSDSHLANFQVSQIYTRIGDLVFRLFID